MSEALIAARLQLQAKSIPVGLFLALVFGGLGVFYVSVFWGIVCTVLELLLWGLVLLTLGWALALVTLAHMAFALLVVILVSGHNKRLLASLEAQAKSS